ncbi:MAG: hypothetical protein JXA30_05350 [Deltaproteobacteria bacterium]|nr:hypothetical protein [Deltaproteobacteria bacterium]
MTRYTIIQLAIMAAAGVVLFYFGHDIAASIVSLLTVAIAALALAAPNALHTFQEIGKRAGAWVGTIIGLCLLTVVYFAIFFPGGLLLRALRIDLLDRGFPTRGKTNWLDRINYGQDPLLYRKSYTRPHADGGAEKAAE